MKRTDVPPGVGMWAFSTQGKTPPAPLGNPPGCPFPRHQLRDKWTGLGLAWQPCTLTRPRGPACTRRPQVT